MNPKREQPSGISLTSQLGVQIDEAKAQTPGQAADQVGRAEEVEVEESQRRAECNQQTAAAATSRAAEVTVQLNDFVGEHGAYQLAITLLLFLRYVLLGLMANSGPLMTPDVTFYCHLPMQEILLIMPNISTLSAREQDLEIKEEFKQICEIDLHLYQNYTQLGNLTHTKSQAKTTPLIVAAGQKRQQQVAATKRLNQSMSHHHDDDNDSSRLLRHNDTWPQTADGAGAVSQQPTASTTSQQQQQLLAATDSAAARIRECTDFTYQMAADQGVTMTNEFDLVCDRDWLRSLFQSLLSASIVVAHVFWGTFSDKYGRFKAQRICLAVSLVAGVMSIFALDFWTFTLTRALCSFGDLGMVVSLTTTVVELVGSRYRGLSVALVNFGYALGVSLLPYVVAYFENFRLVITFTVLCHAVTMPFVLATNESVRWLLTNRKFKQARRELKRISRWNRSWLEFWRSIRKWRRLSATAKSIQPSAMESSSSRTGSRRQKNSKLSEQQRQHKEAFELLFGEFISQIESQNMCDPSCANAQHVPATTPINGNRKVYKQASGHASKKNQLGRVPTISIDKHDEDEDDNRAVREPLRNQTTERETTTTTTIFSDIHDHDQRHHRSATSSRANSTTSSCATGQRDICSLYLGGGGGRALSCAYIDKAAGNQEDEGQGARNESFKSADQQNGPTQLDTIESRRQQLLDAKLKTLTLPPALSRESSFCNEDDETIETHLRHRQAEESEGRPSYQSHKQQPDCINLVAHQLSFMGRVNRLFRDKKLMICVFTIVWTTFNSELLYTSFIIINLEVGEDVYLNYILGGCMEALAAIMASLLLSYSPRRVSLIAFWLLISFSCFGLSLAHIDSHWAVWMLALAKFSQSSLSSIASVAAYESFPTFLRQSGSGLVFTLGMLGSVFAPLILAEFDDHAGMDRVLMTFSVSSLTAAILIYLYLNETRNCELQ